MSLKFTLMQTQKLKEVTKIVLAFLGLANDSSQGSLLEISQFEMFMLPKLFFHLNLFMASSNTLFNQSDNFKSCLSYAYFTTYAIQYPFYKLYSQNALYYSYILDLQESQGFIMEFDIKVSNCDSNQYNVVIQLYSLVSGVWYLIGIDKNYNLFDYFYNESMNGKLGFITRIEENKWNKIIVFLQLKFDQIVRYFYLNGNLMSVYSYKNILHNKQFTFWIANTVIQGYTNRLLQFGTIKVYLGGFVQQCDDCKLKISDQECLYCANPSDYLEEAQNSSCKSSCSYPFQNLINSQTRICSFIPDQGMCNNGRDRFFTNDCNCPKGQYYDIKQQKCLSCLQYCKSCKDAYSCDPNDILSYNDNPKLVLGVQSPLYPNTYPLCGYISSNNWILKGDLSMRFFPNILFTFFQEDLKIIADFNFLDYQQQFLSNQNLILYKMDSSITLEMITTNYLYDQIKGILFKSNNQAIINLDKKLNQVPFVIKITFTSTYNLPCTQLIQQLFSLNNQDTELFSFKLRSNYLDYKFQLEVCTFDQICKRFTKSKVNYKDPNFLIIKVENLSSSEQLTLLKFSIVLNFIEDETQIEIPQKIFIPPYQYQIKIFGQSIIFYSTLQIYTGGFYYVEYDNSDPCFIYINRQNMICILPKLGFAISKQGDVILPTECNNGIKQNQPLYFYNNYTMMCQNSGIILPNCLNINIFDQKCIQCFESQMILSKNCQCPDGMFFNQISQSCKICSPLCKTCQENKDNCLECKNSNQTPPHCDCSQHNYFIDNNLKCQKCNQQCDSCIQNPSYCLSCSKGRISSPFCYCNPNVYLNNISDPITDSCQRKSCPNKCLFCDENNECVLCRGDRLFPPYCVCTQNYYDDPMNELEFCQKCEDGFYFDEIQQKCIMFAQQMQQYYIEASFDAYYSNNQYKIIIQFDYQINYLENIINQNGINNLFYLHIGRVNSTDFQMLNFTVSDNNQKLTLYVNLLQNIYQTSAILLFKKTKIFKNDEFNFVLNPAYSQKPYQFNIGPYYLETTMTISIENIPENQYTLRLVSQLQIVFYILNSIQPTSMFILLNIQIPPNLYQYLQQFAKYVYMNVSKTQSDRIQNDFSLFGLNVNNYVNSTSYQNLKRLGFSDSILVNCQMILYYPLIISMCCCILNLLTALMTSYLRPYKYLFISVIKIIGDILLSTVWIIMFLIINFNHQHSSNIVLDSSDIDYYLILGYSASIILTIFNGIFLINLILETFAIPLFQKYKQFQQKKQQTTLANLTNKNLTKI
ncbi:hypothetical protein ABPG74_001892 [Tetrahymena malaccensis]